jgi:hypothetical protein
MLNFAPLAMRVLEKERGKSVQIQIQVHRWALPYACRAVLGSIQAAMDNIASHASLASSVKTDPLKDDKHVMQPNIQIRAPVQFAFPLCPVTSVASTVHHKSRAPQVAFARGGA